MAYEADDFMGDGVGSQVSNRSGKAGLDSDRGDGSGGEEERQEENTAVINSSICPGMEPGDELVLRIVSAREGEYVVEYAPKSEAGPEQMADEPEAEPEGYGMD